MAKPAAFNTTEFARFILSGIAAASGNLAATWLLRIYVSFEFSLVAGIVTGLAISFALSKWFAFGSRSLQHAGGEVSRFLVVYAISSGIYWVIAIVIGRLFLANGLSTKAAETSGILIGGGTMMLTSYFGHRLFTYRTYRRTIIDLGAPHEPRNS
jgi:putative flippase GtrA